MLDLHSWGHTFIDPLVHLRKQKCETLSSLNIQYLVIICCQFFTLINQNVFMKKKI